MTIETDSQIFLPENGDVLHEIMNIISTPKRDVVPTLDPKFISMAVATQTGRSLREVQNLLDVSVNGISNGGFETLINSIQRRVYSEVDNEKSEPVILRNKPVFIAFEKLRAKAREDKKDESSEAFLFGSAMTIANQVHRPFMEILGLLNLEIKKKA